jgi:ketosteroid isomerase-like protein
LDAEIRPPYDPSFEMDLSDIAPDVGVVRGREVAASYMRDYEYSFEGFHVDLNEVIHASRKQVVTAVSDVGRIPGTDDEVSSERFHVWTFRDGKVVRFSSHLSRSRALEAAGLSE